MPTNQEKDLVQSGGGKTRELELYMHAERWRFIAGLLLAAIVTVLAIVIAEPACAAQAERTVVSRHDGALRGRQQYYEYKMSVTVIHDRVTKKKKKQLTEMLEGLLAEACEDGSCDKASIPFIREDAKKELKRIGIRVRAVKVTYEEFRWRPPWQRGTGKTVFARM